MPLCSLSNLNIPPLPFEVYGPATLRHLDLPKASPETQQGGEVAGSGQETCWQNGCTGTAE